MFISESASKIRKKRGSTIESHIFLIIIYCFYITKFKYHLLIHNLPVPIPYVVSVYGGMRLCSVILVFDDYSKLFGSSDISSDKM